VARHPARQGLARRRLRHRRAQPAHPARVLGVDPSEGFVAHAASHVAGAQPLPVENREFDAVVSELVLNFAPDQPKAVAEMRGAAQPELQLIRRFWDEAIALDPAARELDEGSGFPACRALRALFEDAGLRVVETKAIDVPTPC
jgi:SAM-dependent methyltransferase